jgi:hypothetical protein
MPVAGGASFVAQGGFFVKVKSCKSRGYLKNTFLFF